MKKTVILLASVCGFAVLISGCARNISANSYDARTIGAANNTYAGVIVSMRKVAVEEGDYLEDNKVGGIMGAVAGGVLGNAVGGGRGRTIATAAGALAGAAAGAYAEKQLKSQEGFEYTVKLNSGGMKTIVQGTDVVLYPGQAVLLIEDNKGRSRLVPMK